MELCQWQWERKTCWDILEQTYLENKEVKLVLLFFCLLASLFYINIYITYIYKYIKGNWKKLISCKFELQWRQGHRVTSELTWLLGLLTSRLCTSTESDQNGRPVLCVLGKKQHYAPFLVAYAWMSSVFFTSSLLLQFPDALSSMAILGFSKPDSIM